MIMKESILALLEKHNTGKKKMLVAFLLLVALIVTVSLVIRQQIFRSGAYVDNNAFELRNEQNKELDCDNRVCTTDTLRVKIKLTDPDKLSQ